MFFLNMFNFQSLTCQLILMQVLIILTDDRTCLLAKGDQEEVIKQLRADVETKQIKVITVAVGPHVDLRQLKIIDDGADVLHFGENERYKRVGKALLHSKCHRDLFKTMRTRIHLELF